LTSLARSGRVLAIHYMARRFAPTCTHSLLLEKPEGSGKAIKWVEDFVALAQYQSFSRAAEVRNVTQIPDRTGNLLGDRPDPILSLYATCKKLKTGDADIIAIPRNTAHAFVQRIQPYLGIPIVSMLTVTVEILRESFPALHDVGLLATSGTVASDVYRQALEAQGLRQIVPGPALQNRVMNAIYGEAGVKAGIVTGQCMDDICAALEGFAAQGVEVVIPGCTELPLLLPGDQWLSAGGRTITLVDPTDILARRCVGYATAAARLEADSEAPH
jgi:aspartate racemase